MTSTDTIYQSLNDIFRDILDDNSIDLKPETTAQDVDGWDSLANVQIMLNVEHRFGIRLSAGKIAELRNVGDLVATISAVGQGA